MSINLKPQFSSNGSFDPHFSKDKNSFESNVEGQINLVADKTYIFKQKTPATVWKVSHNLEKYPSVTVVDSGNNTVVGDVSYIDKFNLTITFTGAFSGTVYLN